eukprot:455092_1
MGGVPILSSKSSWLQIIQIAVILLICLILTPIMIYWTCKVYRKRKTIIMQKRYIGLSIVSCCLSIVWMFCGVPVFIWYSFLVHDSSITLPVGVALSNLYPILGHGIMYTHVVRFFLLNFHLNWASVTLSSHWIIHIRKPSSKDKEREKKLMALRAAQQLQKQEQQQLKQKKKKKEKIKKQQKEKPQTHNHKDNKRDCLNPTHGATHDDMMMDNSGHHLSPHPLGNAPLKQPQLSGLNPLFDAPGSDDKTIAIHNHIKFPSQVTESWYIKNRPKYASHKLVLRRSYQFLLIEICAVVFVSVMAAYSHDHDEHEADHNHTHADESMWPNIQNITNFILWLIPCVATIYLWKRTP